MGHVDHGKTSLLDAIRGADVVAHEAGGITQHIGAYQVTLADKSKVTFLDTPGHEAFTEMRARAPTSLTSWCWWSRPTTACKPQTIRAINHTKAAGVPMIVAINKIDKPDAKPQKVREELLQHEVIVEDMGGDVQDVEVSATKKTNLDKLLEAIQLQAEILELKANPDRAAEGGHRGQARQGPRPLATVLVQRGTLRVGDVFVAGASSGKVRALVDDHGRQVKEAGPSVPVEVLGLSAVPSAGDPFTVVENEAQAREVADYRQSVLDKKPHNQRSGQPREYVRDPGVHRKTRWSSRPTSRMVEAIVHALNRLSTDEIKVRVLHSGVGAITESDVTLASASGAPIIGFNVRPNAKAREVAERSKVEFRYYDVIYHLTDWVKARWRASSGPKSSRRSSAAPKSARSSPRARRTRPPACWSPRASSARASTPVDSRGRHRVEGDDQLAPPVQGRRRSARRPRVRRDAGRHQRHQAGRHARGVRGRGARPRSLTVMPAKAGIHVGETRCSL